MVRSIVGAGALAVAAVALLLVTAEPDARLPNFFGTWSTWAFLSACALGLAALLAAVWRGRALRGALLFSLYLVAVSWLVLEGIGWIGWVDWPQRLRPRDPVGVVPQPSIEIEGMTYQDTAWSWRIARAPVPFRFRTDQRGFRNDEDREAADVYLVGDSFVVGAKVPFDATVSGVLEAELGRPVMNVSLIAKGVQRAQKVFLSQELPLGGRLVLQFVFEGNDLKDSYIYRMREKGGGRRSRFRAVDTLTALALDMLQWWTQPTEKRAERQSCHIEGRRYTFGWVDDGHAGFEDEQDHVYASLDAFAARLAEERGDYAVVFIPTKLRVLAPLCVWPAGSRLLPVDDHLSPMRASIAAWSERTGVPVLDLTPALQEAAHQGDIPWFWGDTHWNAHGHQVAAEAIADWLAPAAAGGATRGRAWSTARTARPPSSGR